MRKSRHPEGAAQHPGLNGNADEVQGDHIEVSPAPRQVHLKKRPDGLLTSDMDIPAHGPDEVRGVLERTRR